MKRYAKSQAELAAILGRSPVTLASWAAEALYLTAEYLKVVNL